MYRAPYTQSISRQNKACFLFLLDQSFSMEEPLGNSSNRKCDELVAAINGWLQNMAIRASGDEGIKDWMDIGVFGYRTDQQANPIIESALQGPLAGRMLVSISEIGAAPARIDTRMQYLPDEETGEIFQVPCEMPVWVDPRAEGGTPMCHMLYLAHQILAEWIGQHPRSFPADRRAHHRRRIAGRQSDSLCRRLEGAGHGRRQRAAVQLPPVDDGRRSVHVSRQRPGPARRAGPGVVPHVERAAGAVFPARPGGRFSLAAQRPRHGLQCRHGLFDPVPQHGHPGGAGIALGR